MSECFHDDTREEEQREWLLDQLHNTLKKSSTTSTIARPSAADLSALTKLELPNLGLTELPSCLPKICPNLSILFCPKNKFVEVPAIIGKCPNLQMVSFKDCNTIESIHPEALQPQLRWLILTCNKITKIPDTIGRCRKLQKFMLAGNQISELPPSKVWSELTNLELIRLACNQLTKPPLEILESCPNLRWAAFAGNPFSTAAAGSTEGDTHPSLPVLDDPVLDRDTWPVLGKGAGGVTRKVHWKGRDVAVKTFSGQITSDGSPEDEKMISKLVTTMAAKNASSDNDKKWARVTEPGLIEILGETKIGGALTMEFLEGYSALAGPPSFETCSRDVYCDSSKAALKGFPLWKIATDTLRVLTMLHGMGVCHADFYAHNILIQPKTHSVKISDFGAAFRYRGDDSNAIDDDTAKFGNLAETVELRAYAVLVEELLKLVSSTEDHKIAEHPWKGLLEECQKPGATFRGLSQKFLS